MITTLTGSNDFARTQALRELTQKFIQSYGSDGVERVAGEEIETGRLLDLLQAGNLFAAERLVIVRELSANKSAAEKIDQILESVGSGVDLAIVEPSLDMRTSYAKTLQKKTDFNKFEPLAEHQLASWLTDAAKERQATLNQSHAQLIVDRVGPIQQLLSSELDKLIAYNPAIDEASIKLLIEPSPRSSIFDLLAAAFNGQAEQMLRLYHDQRAQKMEPQAMLSMIAWQLHALLVVKLGGSQSPQSIASEAKLSPYVVRNSQPLARKLSINRLHELIQAVIDLEITLKSKALDADDAVQSLLLQIAAG